METNKTTQEDQVAEASKTQQEEAIVDYSSYSVKELGAAIEKLMEEESLLHMKADVKEIEQVAQDLIQEEVDEAEAEERDQQVESLKKQVEALKRKLRKDKKSLQENQEENLKVKKDLLEKLKSLAENIDNPGQAFSQLQAIQEKWRQTGPVPGSEASTLINNYRLYNDMFFDALDINRELRQLDLKKNLELKEQVCVKMEELAQKENIRQVLREMNDVLEEWKNIGRVPDEEFEKLNERFKLALDKIHERRSQHAEEEKKQKEENLKAKRALCNEVEELLKEEPQNHKGWKKITEKFDEIFERWKKVGFTPKEDQGRVWSDFKKLRRELNKRKDAFYKSLRSEQKDHADVKKSLIEKAEELVKLEDNKQAIEGYKRLSREWKDAPNASRKDEQKLWKQFKAVGDKIFGKIREAREKEMEEWKANAEKRNLITEKLKGLDLKDTFEETTAALQEIHDEWNVSGVVPKEMKQKVYENFQQAYKEFVEKVEKQFGSDELEVAISRLKTKAETITEKGKKTLENKKRTLQKKIKSLQEEITQVENNMGFFKNAKADSPLLKEYNDKIEAGKKQIEKLKKELDIL